MPTDLPYAADAEISLSYDELEVTRYIASKVHYLSLFDRFCAYNTGRRWHSLM
jgi:hypothetical protein